MKYKKAKREKKLPTQFIKKNYPQCSVHILSFFTVVVREMNLSLAQERIQQLVKWQPQSKRHITLLLPTSIIEQLWCHDVFYIAPKGANQSDLIKLVNSRLDLIQDKVQEPSQVWYSPYYQVLVVEHGRHRLANLRDAGAKYLPVTISRHSLQHLVLDVRDTSFLSLRDWFSITYKGRCTDCCT